MGPAPSFYLILIKRRGGETESEFRLELRGKASGLGRGLRRFRAWRFCSTERFAWSFLHVRRGLRRGLRRFMWFGLVFCRCKRARRVGLASD